jgi:hypothetical protein
VLFRLTYLGVTNALAMLRLLPMSDRAKDAEILALRHQIMVLERRLHGQRLRFTPADRALLAALLHRLCGCRLCRPPWSRALRPRDRISSRSTSSGRSGGGLSDPGHRAADGDLAEHGEEGVGQS